jgi:hypothetical protein
MVRGSNPGEGRFSAPVQTNPGVHPASCTLHTGSFLEVESDQDMTLTPHPLLVPRSKKQSRAIPLLPLRVFMACKKGETYLPTFKIKLYSIPKLNMASGN